ncbi:hypothetical protein [Candidatus Accumulibacter sp. ACC005]|uniref:hypothetical protein n=1 Tax=Candidatus Accumulibacter sp. ACC005 TaxID=2823331 RepID=UPI0025BA091E|nr:hypothetical protein [Candidatus Accumulibacter sp. ACC005]
MATENSNPSRTPFNYPCEVAPVYAIAEGASANDLCNHLDTRLAHLSALLEVAYGGGGEAFRGYSNEIQDQYLWACAQLADECRELFPQVMAKTRETASL